MLTRNHPQRGFTLIELMIGIAIIGLLLTQALPSFSAWLQNLQIRNSAEGILNGLQVARAQALRSNTSTQFVLVAAGTDPSAANVDAAGNVAGTNWIVRNFQPLGVYTAADFVQGHSGQEGSRNAAVVADQAAFVFSPLGRLLNPPVNDIAINVSSASPFTDQRPMRVIVTRGGQILMCDPARSFAATGNNPQFCPP